MALPADQLDEFLAPANPRSTTPPRLEPVLDKDVVSLCARQRYLLEYAFCLADHGHTHVGDLIALSRYTLLDLADGNTELVDGLERLLGHLGMTLETPALDWQAPPSDTIDGLLD